MGAKIFETILSEREGETVVELYVSDQAKGHEDATYVLTILAKTDFQQDAALGNIQNSVLRQVREVLSEVLQQTSKFDRT